MLNELTADGLIPRGRVATADRNREYEDLVRSCSGNLYRYALWRCQDPALAEDLVQETFLRAWKSFDQLTCSEAARAWLIRILRNELARRYQKRRPEETTEMDLDRLPGCAGGEFSPETRRVRKGLARLPVNYREPLVLQVLGGFDMAEIADILGLSKGAVMTRVFRARQKLRVLLEEESHMEARES